MMLQTSLILLSALGIAHGQVTSDKSCPQTKVQKDIDLNRVEGLWFEMAGRHPRFCENAKCTRIIHSPSKINNATDFMYIKYKDESTGKIKNVYGEVEEVENGIFKGSFKNTVIQDSVYHFLELDYDNFGVVWGCRDGEVLIWIITRDPSPSEEVKQKYLQVLKRNNISEQSLVKIDQSNCE